MMEEQITLLQDGKRAFGRMGLAMLVMSLSSVAVELLLMLLLEVVTLPEGSWLNWALTFVPLYAVGVPLALLLMKTIPAQPAEKTSLSGESFLLYLVMSIPLMYIGNILGTALSSLLSGGEAENVLLDYAFDTSPLKILVMVVLAPLLEELVFRKFLLDRTAAYGEKTAVLFSALLFAMFHMNLFQFFYAFALGWLFAFVYVRTRRLVYPVILHMVINFMGSVLAPWVVSIVDLEALEALSQAAVLEGEILTELPGILAYLLYTMLVLVLSFSGIVVLIIRRKTFRLDHGPLPAARRIKMAYGSAGTILFLLLCVAVCVLSLVSI